MSVGYTPDAFGLLILLGFAAVAGLGIVWLVGRTLFAAIGLGRGWAPAVFVAALAGGVLSVSLALDTVGERASAVVTSKRETVAVNRRGGWNRTRQIGARTTSRAPEQLLTLSPSEARYDALAEGDAIPLRLLRAGPLSVVRDAQLTTGTWLPWGWLAGGAVTVVLVVGLWRVSPSVVVVAAVAAGLAWPLLQAWRDARHASDLAAMTTQATGVVQDVTRVTEWHLGSQSGRRSNAFSHYELAQPYDVVTLLVTPTGARSAVLAVDAVDVAADAPPTAARGATLPVRFAPGAPRDVRLDGHTRRWHWRDMAGVYGENAAVLAVIVAAAVALSWGSDRLRQAVGGLLRRR